MAAALARRQTGPASFGRFPPNGPEGSGVRLLKQFFHVSVACLPFCSTLGGILIVLSFRVGPGYGEGSAIPDRLLHPPRPGTTGSRGGPLSLSERGSPRVCHP